VFKKALTLITIATAIVYCLAMLTPHISSVDWWVMTFLALGYPYALAAITLLAIVWLFVEKRVTGLLFLVLLWGFKNLSSTVAISFNAKTVTVEKDTNDVRVLSWNVQDFTNSAIAADSPTANRRQIMNYIKTYQPDIICIQDFSELQAPGVYSNLAEISDSLHYPYQYVVLNINNKRSFGQVGSGIAIFSRFPIIDSGAIALPKIVFNESVAFIDVQIKQQTIRVFNTHLTSMQLFLPDDVELDTAWLQYDNGFIYRANMFDKLRRYDQLHVQQALTVKKTMNQSPYPFIFCADLNTTPAGSPYHIIRKNLQDAFLKKGNGLGSTYENTLPTIRIDYILADRRIKVQKFSTGKVRYSDHYPIIADIRLPQ
jgi:endonuclease/exonuclease/phosphatase family metal-dependent hydrolase